MKKKNKLKKEEDKLINPTESKKTTLNADNNKLRKKIKT